MSHILTRMRHARMPHAMIGHRIPTVWHGHVVHWTSWGSCLRRRPFVSRWGRHHGVIWWDWVHRPLRRLLSRSLLLLCRLISTGLLLWFTFWFVCHVDSTALIYDCFSPFLRKRRIGKRKREWSSERMWTSSLCKIQTDNRTATTLSTVTNMHSVWNQTITHVLWLSPQIIRSINQFTGKSTNIKAPPHQPFPH